MNQQVSINQILSRLNKILLNRQIGERQLSVYLPVLSMSSRIRVITQASCLYSGYRENAMSHLASATWCLLTTPTPPTIWHQCHLNSPTSHAYPSYFQLHVRDAFWPLLSIHAISTFDIILKHYLVMLVAYNIILDNALSICNYFNHWWLNMKLSKSRMTAYEVI